MELDYKSIKDDLTYELDPILCKAAQYAPGIRILQQGPFGRRYAVLLFHKITTFPRIKGIVSRLCEHFERRYLAVLHFPHRKFLQTAQWKI